VRKYDGETEKEGKMTSMNLPKWVIDNTFNALVQKTKLLNDLRLDMDRFSARMENSGQRSFTSEAFRSTGRQSKRPKKISRYAVIGTVS
jgi:hypothetical protein